MLAWVMNMGFAASASSAPAQTFTYPAPIGMGLGDELWFTATIVLSILTSFL